MKLELTKNEAWLVEMALMRQYRKHKSPKVKKQTNKLLDRFQKKFGEVGD